MKTRLFSILLLLSATMTLSAATSFQYGDLWYEIAGSNTVMVRSNDDNYAGLSSVNIPSTVAYDGENYNVTSIGSSAFRACKSLISVTISSGITSIGESAFYGCNGLASIVIPNSIVSIGESAFYGCSGLTSITIPNSVTSIGHAAFNGCTSLVSVTISNSITWIGYRVFQDCSGLTSITIPNSVTSIGSAAFSGCSSLTSITIPDGVTSIGSAAFSGCSSLTSITIPDGVTSIGSATFHGCSSLASINIPDGVTSIGSSAFEGCSSLTSIAIPDGVTSIDRYVFDGCSSLTSITIPEEVTSIGRCAFQDCSSLISVNIPNRVTDIEYDAFRGCNSLTSIIIPGSVTKMGVRTFFGCSSLTSVSILNSVMSIGNQTFAGCSSLTSITIPSSITTIGPQAFQDCSSLTSVVILDGVTDMGYGVFSGCSSLTSVTIPNSITDISKSTFSNCSSLTSITIPNSITSIGEFAFYGCSGLTSITIPDGVTSIGGSAFDSCSSLISITIPSSVTSIGATAFQDCSSLESINIPKSVTIIGDGAFQDCSSLESVVWEAKTCRNKFRKAPFAGCNIATFVFGNEVDSIPMGLCSGNTIVSITMGKNVTYIGADVFYNCKGLKSVAWNAKNCKNVSAPFRRASDSVTTFTLGDEVEYIPSHLCEGMKKLAAVTIPSSVTQIGDGAFLNCSNTEFTFISDTPPQCGTNSFDGARGKFMIPCWSEEKYRAALGDHDFVEPESDYQLSVQSGDSIGGSASIEKEPTCRNIGIISVTSNYGYHFAQWSDGNTDNPRTITLTGDTAFTAEFAKNQYSVSTSVNNGDWGTAKGDTSAFYLDSVTLSAMANYGYHFAQWSDGNADNPRTITLTVDTAFTAEFVKNQYSVSTFVNNNDWGSAKGATTALYLDSVTLRATANYGYHFAQWRDGNTDNPRTVTITGDTTFTAEFAKNQYSVSTSVNNGDWGTAKGDTSAFYLDSVTLSATANYGYHFAYWQDTNGILVSTDNPAKMEVIRDTTYTAVFEKNTYSITAQPANPEQGQVTAPASGQYMDYVAMEAYSNYGYYFSRWSDGNYDNPRFVMLTCDTTFTAEFARNQYYVHTIVNNDDWGSSVESNPFPLYLDTITLSATANYGYHFTYWQDEYGTPISTDNPLKIVVIESTVYTAVFERNTYSITVQSANPEQGYVTAPTDAQYLDEVFMEAIPSYGYHFVQWSDSDTNNPRRFILTGDTAFTAEFAISRSGQCGDYLYWQYDNRTLTISGTGSMYDYSTDTAPWLLFCDSIENVVVESGCTNINNRAFYGLSCAEKVELPNTLISIGTDAFSGCSKLSSIYLPATLTTIGADAFAGCRKLYDIHCYAAEPPVADNSSFVNYNVNLYVPCDNLRDYQMDAVFGSFKYIQCMGAENTNTNDSITITPSTNDAVFIWRADETADTYTLQITKDDEVFCTLVFNANGQLRSIAFAPSRNGHPAPRAAEQTAAGFRFTVTGLSQKTHYAFEMKVKDKDDQLLKAYTGEFDTTADTPLATDNVCSEQDTVRKVMHNGQLLIIRGGKTYTATGVEVK